MAQFTNFNIIQQNISLYIPDTSTCIFYIALEKASDLTTCIKIQASSQYLQVECILSNGTTIVLLLIVLHCLWYNTKMHPGHHGWHVL